MKGFPDHADRCLRIESPVGPLVLLATSKGLAGVFFGHRLGDATLPPSRPNDPLLLKVSEQLTEYFSGQRKSFDIPFDVCGTRFQEQVWEQLRQIPFGSTWSYGDIARRLSNPGAVRAVGLANGSNPVSIIVPCHRVIGSDGSLTGFGGGLDIKQKLLVHEGVLLAAF